MSYSNQVTGLPFSYQGPTSQIVQFRNDNFPFIPNVSNCPQQMQYIIPAICSMIANESAQRCGAHPGRMFLFNQLSFNNWGNNEFVTAIATVIDILQLNLAKGMIRSVEEGVQKAVSDTLSIMCSLNFQTFPALQSVTDPNIVNDAQRNIQAFSSLQNEICQFKNRSQNPQQFQQPQFQQPFQQQVYQQSPQMMVNPAFNNPVNQFANVQFANNQPINSGIGSGNSTIFSNSGTTQPLTSFPAKTSAPTGKYDYLKPSSPIIDQKSYFTKEPLQHVSAKPGEVTATAFGWPDDTIAPLKWTPSSQQAYPLTINPYTHKHGLKEMDIHGKKFVFSYLIPLKEEEMDRARHTITTMQQVMTAHIPEQYGTREESLTESVKNMFRVTSDELNLYSKPPEELSKEDAEALAEVKCFINPKMGLETFLEAAIFDGRLSQKQSQLSDTECAAYRIYKIIATPVVGTEDHSSFIGNISACKSFREIAAILSETLTLHSSERSLISLCYEIEKILTKEINSVLRNKMSLPGINIDSFIDDVNDLPEYLGKTFGDLYKRAFLEFQKDYITQLIGNCNGEGAEALRYNLIDEDENKAVINFIARTYSLTYLNVDSSELCIKPYDECASSLMEDENKLMFAVASGIFKQDKEFNREALHNLIITNDDKMFEIFTGMIGKDFYTICEA